MIIENQSQDFSCLRPASSIYEAYKRLKKTITRTPLMFSNSLSEKYKANIWLKREDL